MRLLDQRDPPRKVAVADPAAAQRGFGEDFVSSWLCRGEEKRLGLQAGTSVDLVDDQEFTTPFLFAASAVMTIACVCLGIFPL